jgi:hypothetical protein
VKKVAPRRNEEEHNGEKGPTMPSVIQSHLAKKSSNKGNQTDQISMLDLSESGVQAEVPPSNLEQVHVETPVQAPGLAQRSTPTVDVLDDRCTQQPSTKALIQVHERERVSAPNAQRDIHETLSEDKVLV